MIAIDTEGLQEGADKDKRHINEMLIRLINIDYINAIFIVLSGVELMIPQFKCLKHFRILLALVSFNMLHSYSQNGNNPKKQLPLGEREMIQR